VPSRVPSNFKGNREVKVHDSTKRLVVNSWLGVRGSRVVDHDIDAA
jgi:hypothetical protein